MIYYSFIFRAEKRGESEWDEKWEVNIQWYSMQRIILQSLLPWNCLSKIDLNYAKYAANYFVDQNRKLYFHWMALDDHFTFPHGYVPQYHKGRVLESIK